MDEQTVKEAENWLEQFYDDLRKEDRNRKATDNELSVEVSKEIRLYSPELQQAIYEVLRRWLQGDVWIRAARAQLLILCLRATEFTPVLQQLLDDVRSGRRSAEVAGDPSSLERIIERLEGRR